MDEKLGEKSEIFNGMGTVNEPYEIKNVEDLIKLSESVNNGKDYAGLIFKLEDNIDFSGVQNFLSIGNNPNNSEEKATFAGTFDGNAKSITGITKNGDTLRYLHFLWEKLVALSPDSGEVFWAGRVIFNFITQALDVHQDRIVIRLITFPYLRKNLLLT